MKRKSLFPLHNFPCERAEFDNDSSMADRFVFFSVYHRGIFYGEDQKKLDNFPLYRKESSYSSATLTTCFLNLM